MRDRLQARMLLRKVATWSQHQDSLEEPTLELLTTKPKNKLFFPSSALKMIDEITTFYFKHMSFFCEEESLDEL